MLELARQQGINITEDIIRKLHRLFYQKVDADQAGQYRSIQVYIFGSEYVPPAPDEPYSGQRRLWRSIYPSRLEERLYQRPVCFQTAQ